MLVGNVRVNVALVCPGLDFCPEPEVLEELVFIVGDG